MTKRRIVRILATVCIGLVFCFLAELVEAQRRGGGGGRGGGRGGGGRSISRSGPAAGGSFRTHGSSRPAQRPSTVNRPSTGTPPATRPSTPTTRPSTPTTRPGSETPTTRPGTGTGTTRPGSGTGATRPERPADGSNREDWQQHADDAREDRQKYQKNAREDWQDFYEEGGGGYYYGGYYGYPRVVDYDEYHDNDDWAIALAGFAVGTALTSAAFTSMQTNTACTLSEVSVNGVRYFKCGSTWYNRVIDGTNVNYVIVGAPAGY